MDKIKPFEPLFGEWYAESFIGAGSFGRVYKIYREELGDRLYSAMKYISIPQDHDETEAMESEGMSENDISTYYGKIAYQLRDEIRLMNELKGNTNIVSYEDSRITPKPDGMGYDIFIRMELLTSLKACAKKKTIGSSDVVKLGVDICSALTLCEKRGILHRDIKPDNIFVNDNGDYKLGDFGIARRLEKTATFMSKKGTYNYMAPEVYKGEKYGASCDIYSLGMVMYFYLNKGRLPFLPPAPQPISPDDRENAIVRRMKGEPIHAPCDADGELAAIVLKACAYDPKDRFASAEEIKDALTRYSNGEHGIVSFVPVSDFNQTDDDSDETQGVFGQSNSRKASDGIDPNATFGVFTAPANEATKVEDVTDSDKTHGAFADAIISPAVEPPKRENGEKTPESDPDPVKTHKEDKPRNKRSGLIAGIAAALAFALGLCAILMVFSRKASNTNISAKANTPEPTAAEYTLAPSGTPVPTATATLNPTLTPTTVPTTPTPTPAATPTPVPVTTANPDPTITFTDTSFENAIRSACGFTGAVRQSQIASITKLDLSKKNLSNISDISHFTNLTELDLNTNNLSDISALKSLTKLTKLKLYDNNIENISALANLSNLVHLDLTGNKISNISSLSGLTKLTYLCINHNSITDISALSNMTKLETLSLSYNNLSSINVLKRMTNLTHVDMVRCGITDISALSELTKLKQLLARVNRISDLTPLRNLTNLEHLELNENNISDTSGIEGLTKLNRLFITDNNISSIEGFKSLHSLTYIDLSRNPLTDSQISELSSALGNGCRVIFHPY